MNNRKIGAIAVAAALTAFLGLAGCSSAPAPSSNTDTTPAASSAAATTSSAPKSSAASSAAPSNTNATTSSAASNTQANTSSAAQSSAAPAPSAAPSTASYIGDQVAIDTALKDAGFTAADVTALTCELDLDDAVVHYDVDFKQGGMEFDYDIDATSGAIITKHSEVDD